MKNFFSILCIVNFLVISNSTLVKANPWLIFEGINLGIMLLDEISGSNSKTKKNTTSNSNNITINKLPQSIPVATSQNPYDGVWTGYDSCYSRNNNKRDFNYTIIINRGAVLLANQHAINLNQYETNFKSLVMKGKVLKKGKVGINGIYGFLGGKFTSKNKLVLKFRDEPSCSFVMTKIQDKSNISIVKTNKTNNKFILYCKDKRGNVFTRDKGLFTDCGLAMDEISKTEFDARKNNKTNKEIQVVNTNENKKEEEIKQTVVVTKDNTGPKIHIANSFEAESNLLALIKGSVSDDSKIVQVTVDNDPVSFKNGKFSQKLFVKPGGQNILITAMDKFGNQSSKTVQLKRSSKIIITKVFDDLNPTLIRASINPSAVALIIGIEEYQNTFAAPFAKNDALAFNDFANTSLGVPQQNIKLLMDNEAGRTNTLKTLVKWLPKIVKENTSDIYIFFSGHGLASDDGEELYLLPSDGDPELLEDSTLMRNQLFGRIAKLNPRSVTVFLDTCYSGATRTEEFLLAAKPIFIEAQEQDIPDKFTVFSASAGRETAKILEEAEHGLFSYYMMKGLEGEADANSDNQITNGELIAFINKNVSRQANQTPQLNGDPNQVLVSW